MSRRLVVAALLTTSATLFAQAAPHQVLAHDIYKQLVEINTADSVGNVTVAAQAMAKRFLDAGFPASDVQVLIPERQDKGNLIVRYHASGTPTRKPLMLLAHL